MSDQPDFTNPRKKITFAGQELILEIDERNNPASDVTVWLRDYLSALSTLVSQAPGADISGGDMADLLSPAESMAHMVYECISHKAAALLLATLPAALIALQFIVPAGGVA